VNFTEFADGIVARARQDVANAYNTLYALERHHEEVLKKIAATHSRQKDKDRDKTPATATTDPAINRPAATGWNTGQEEDDDSYETGWSRSAQTSTSTTTSTGAQPATSAGLGQASAPQSPAPANKTSRWDSDEDDEYGETEWGGRSSGRPKQW